MTGLIREARRRSRGRAARRAAVAVLAIAAMLFVSLAQALGLGQATVRSYHRQPLDVRIDLISRSEAEMATVTAGLASPADFQVMGLNRSAIAVPLEFTIHRDLADPHIRVTSQLPMDDVVVQLVVEVVWSSGRMLRQYTLFLDPPAFDAPRPLPPTTSQRPVPPAGVTVSRASEPEIGAVTQPATRTTSTDEPQPVDAPSTTVTDAGPPFDPVPPPREEDFGEMPGELRPAQDRSVAASASEPALPSTPVGGDEVEREATIPTPSSSTPEPMDEPEQAVSVTRAPEPDSVEELPLAATADAPPPIDIEERPASASVDETVVDATSADATVVNETVVDEPMAALAETDSAPVEAEPAADPVASGPETVAETVPPGEESMAEAVEPSPGAESAAEAEAVEPSPGPEPAAVAEVAYPRPEAISEAAVPASEAPEPPAAPTATPEPEPVVRAVLPTAGQPLPSSLDVQQGDTLWGLSRRYAEDQGASINQVMLAVQQMNPDAFIDGNINAMRAGEILRMPDREDTLAFDARQAMLEVQRQEERYRARWSAPAAPDQLPTIDNLAQAGVGPSSPADSQDPAASPETEAEPGAETDMEGVAEADSELATEADSDEDSRLVLVPPSEGEAEEAMGQGNPGDTGVSSGETVVEELARTQEELVNAQQENAYLADRIAELEAELARKDAQDASGVADTTLAEMEDRLREERLDDTPEPELDVTPDDAPEPFLARFGWWLAGFALLVLAGVVLFLRGRRDPDYLRLGPASERKEPITLPDVFPEEEDEEATRIQPAGGGADEAEAALDLARAFLAMGDEAKAREQLELAMAKGDAEQLREARDMLSEL